MSGRKDNTPPRHRSDAEWFRLIAPAIDTEAAEATPDDVIEFAKQHAEQVVERTGLQVDLSAVEWSATYELSAKHGYAYGNFLKLSMDSLRTNGWQWLMRIVRHELVHVWQYQHQKFDEHGDSFERWMPVLDIPKAGGQVMPTWTIHCPSCREAVYTTERAEDVAKRFHENDSMSLRCRDCEATVLEGDVQRDGEPADPEDLPPVYLPSSHQKRIFLHASADPWPAVKGFEWLPVTVNLTELPGIGDATAERLGDDVFAIDDMVEDGGLARAVETIVPNHHTALEETVLELYDEAKAARTGDDLELFRRVLAVEPRHWWHPIERIGGTGPVERLWYRLDNEVGHGDRLAIEFDALHGTFPDTVVEDHSSGATQELGLRFDHAIEGRGDEGRLHVRDSTYWSWPVVVFRLVNPRVIGPDTDQLVTERVEVVSGT